MIESSQYTVFWCHICNNQFLSDLRPGQSEIRCTTCGKDFCEIASSPAKKFKPYQKSPQKQHQLKLTKYTQPVTIHQLHQVLQQQQHIREGIEISEDDLEKYYRRLDQDGECSVCRQDLRAGSRHLMFQCRHAFHKNCLVQWLKIKNSCPTCRTKMIS